MANFCYLNYISHTVNFVRSQSVSQLELFSRQEFLGLDRELWKRILVATDVMIEEGREGKERERGREGERKEKGGRK